MRERGEDEREGRMRERTDAVLGCREHRRAINT